MSVYQEWPSTIGPVNSGFLTQFGSYRYIWSSYDNGEDSYSGPFLVRGGGGILYPISPPISSDASVYAHDAYIYMVSYEFDTEYYYVVLAKTDLSGEIIWQKKVWRYPINVGHIPNIRKITTSQDKIFIELDVVGLGGSSHAPILIFIDKETIETLFVRRYSFQGQYGSDSQLVLVNNGVSNFYCARIRVSSESTNYWIGSFAIDPETNEFSIVDGQRYTYDGDDLNFGFTDVFSEDGWVREGLLLGKLGDKYGRIGLYEEASTVTGFDYVIGTKYQSTYNLPVTVHPNGSLYFAEDQYIDISEGLWIDSTSPTWYPDSNDVDINCTPTSDDYYQSGLAYKDYGYMSVDESYFTFSIDHYDSGVVSLNSGQMTISEFPEMLGLNFIDLSIGIDLGEASIFASSSPIDITSSKSIEVPDLAVQTCGYTYRGDNVYEFNYNLYCMHTSNPVSVYFEYGRGGLTHTTESNTGIVSTQTNIQFTANTPPGYTYSYRAVAVDSMGRKAYGAIRTITGSIVTLPTATISRVGSIKHVYDRTQAGIPPKFYMEVNLGGLAPEYMEAFNLQPVTYNVLNPPAWGIKNGGRPDPVYPSDDTTSDTGSGSSDTSYNDYPPGYDPPWPNTDRPKNGGRPDPPWPDT